MDLHLTHPDSRQQSQIGGRQHPACGQDRGTFAYIFACLSRVDGALDRPVKGNDLPIGGAIFLQHDGIDPVGQDCTGQDAHRVAQRHDAVEWLAGGGATDHERQALHPLACCSMGKAITIDGGIGPGWVRPTRHGGGGQNAAMGMGHGQILGSGHRVKPRAQECERLINGHPFHALRHGKTIIAQTRRGQTVAHSPTSARIKAAIPATSFKSKRGSGLSNGSSLAIARIVGFDSAKRSRPAACRCVSILGCGAVL